MSRRPEQISLPNIMLMLQGNNGVHQRETCEAKFLMIYICLESI